jgi:hypothetical protein
MSAIREFLSATAIGGGVYMLSYGLVGPASAGYAAVLIAIGVYLALSSRHSN